jgi:hypothetical protein
VVWDTAVARLVVPPTSAPVSGGATYQLGAPGDRLLLGDWNADGTDEPALYRPSTGQVFRFDGWAGADSPRPNTSVEATGVAGGRAWVDRRAGNGPDAVAVARA